MSDADSPVKHPVKTLLTSVIAAGVLLLIVLLYFWSQGGTGGKGGAEGKTDTDENSLITARDSLAKNTDLSTCRSAVLQINSHLATHPELRPPAVPADQKKWLQEFFGLDEGELDEVAGGNYTALDAYHLELCFLLRDAARSLEVKTPGANQAAQQTPLDLATAAFAWVAREVRLDNRAPQLVPPQYVLQRGWGSAVERALVFLTLLTQFGAYDGKKTDLTGCLLWVRDKPDAEPRLWACGVVADKGGDLYLFDPRLGLPLPGPDGKGVATLAAVRKDPSVLAQLTTGEHRYDVTAEQAQAAEAQVVFPLSALAPRMGYLQETLLPHARVRLATEAAAEVDRLKAAVSAGSDKPMTVGPWKEGVVLLRQFLPIEDGGVDKGEPVPLAALAGFTTPDDPAVVRLTRKQLFELQLAPWTVFPRQLSNPSKFSYNVGLGLRVRDYFRSRFAAAATEPGNVRDSMIRGRYESAISKLTNEREEWRKALVAHGSAVDLEKAVEEWVEKARHVYAEQLRRRGAAAPQAIESAPEIQALWQGPEAKPLVVLMDGAIAGPRLADVLYQLGLCKQNQAEQIQARLDLQARTPGATPDPTDVQKARETWKNAVNRWTNYQEDYPKGPQAVAVRRLLGRARAMLGDAAGAVKAWEDLTEPMAEPEKVAALYLAKQIQKK
jgi:hypothetical protein